MNKIKKILLAIGILIVLLIGFYSFWLSPRYTAPILMYHEFGYEESTLFVTPENFEQQMKYLKDKKYNTISLDELVTGLKAGKKFPHNTVVITIDDGWRDNYTVAYPVLKKYDLPATIFLVANYMDQKADYLTWEQVCEMAQNNIDFGGHTANNKYVPSLDAAGLQTELAGCKQTIEANLGKTIDYFCYPTGGFTEEAKKVLKEAGYKGACSTNRGFDRFNKYDFYEITRAKATNSDTTKPFSFWAKLSGYYNLFRKARPGH